MVVSDAYREDNRRFFSTRATESLVVIMPSHAKTQSAGLSSVTGFLSCGGLVGLTLPRCHFLTQSLLTRAKYYTVNPPPNIRVTKTSSNITSWG